MTAHTTTEATTTTRTAEGSRTERSLQPLLHDSVVTLRAPTQAWSAEDGDMGASPIHGVYLGDGRAISGLRVRVGGAAAEPVSCADRGASGVTFVGLVRTLDDDGADPRVRLERRRDVSAAAVEESVRLLSRVDHPLRTTLSIEIDPDFSPMQGVKAGIVSTAPWRAESAPHGVVVTNEATTLTITAPGATLGWSDGTVRAEWALDVDPHATVEKTIRLDLEDTSLVVIAPSGRADWHAAGAGATPDPRLDRWVDAALDDLDALRLALPDHPEDEFLAAGAPWFFTLFGRDSIWAARFLLPVSSDIAASTLRVLARLQGTTHDPESAEQPGKIMHELRSTPLSIPGENITLPPVYYGTVDATALWVALLADARDAGMSELAVVQLLPTLRGCLNWILQSGDNDGDGFLDYVDLTGHGLANQGWKDSGDSIQWRDGTLAEGPIALCEVQGYAYEAVVAGARLLDEFGDGSDDTDALRAWAADLKSRFAEAYWVETTEGRYPAVALDAQKRPVDSLTSNIGHLLGTGILEPDEERAVAALLVGPSMSSGFGLRTLSTGAAGYWPLSYHGGSVWTHDTGIAIAGMTRAGCHDEARILSESLLAAAERFGFRLPELHSGDARSEFSSPTPYPAACRPQAWSAAAVFAVRTALIG